VPRNNVLDIRISQDGSKVFHLSEDFIQAWSVWTGEVLGKVWYPFTLSQGTLLTIDGPRVWVSTEGWDFGISGLSPIPLSGVLPDKPFLDFFGGVRKYKTVLPGIVDTVTGQVVFQLPTGFMGPSDSQWDGQYLVAGYENGEVLILDFKNMLPQ
jgi:hypothetical protein